MYAEHLALNLGVPAEAIRVKSAQNDELGNEDLLSEYSQVRWIITKAALMEGWDCPFAYVLVMLDNTTAQRAITQLVGRVMRQPHARRTEREPLDQCYVYCWNTDVGVAVEQVKNGLEQEGLTGLGGQVFGASSELKRVKVRRRERFQNKNIFLPLVLHKDGGGWTELDYQRHILSCVDWQAIPELDPQGRMPEPVAMQSASVDVGDSLPVFHQSRELYIDKTLSVSWFSRRLADVTPNAWQAARLSRRLIARLLDGGESDDQIYDRRTYLAQALRDHIKDEVEGQAEKIFQDKLLSSEIRFDLEAGQPNFKMVQSYKLPVAVSDQTLQFYGRQLKMSLFEPVYDRHFDSDLERSFARYLDEKKAVKWWHRVAVRQGGDYYLRGWKQERIWPDFIAMAGHSENEPHLLVFETKGEHLRGNEDTDYKLRVFQTLENAFNVGSITIRDGPARGTFKLIFSEEEFPLALSNLETAYCV